MLLKEKKEIETWLNQYNIKNYKLIEDQEYGYIVNVYNNIYLGNKNLKSIEVKFNDVHGDFDCGKNQLESLEGCPNKILGYFTCSNNKLKSLKNCPEVIGTGFHCNNNLLTSLKGCPKFIDGTFNCSSNQLESLEGCPEVIKDYFYCNNNLLIIENLKYLPKEIKSNYIQIDNNNLDSLEYMTCFYTFQDHLNYLLKIKEEKENLLNDISENLNNKKIIKKI